jgi:8-oxo-dGTP pyrophosphatase MutT (NUDIX family)
MSELLDLVDENDVVIGQEERAIIHRDGLLHREINIFFVTPDKKILFQMRKPKPPMRVLPLLDATVGGHVDLGETHQQAALRELTEETGLIIDPDQLCHIDTLRIDEEFPAVGIKNNVWRGVFVYYYDGTIDALRFEQEKALGFISVALEDIAHPTEEFLQKMTFIDSLRSQVFLDIYKKILIKPTYL